MLADPIIWTVMKSDGVDENELRNLLKRLLWPESIAHVAFRKFHRPKAKPENRFSNYASSEIGNKKPTSPAGSRKAPTAIIRSRSH
jgi:hypothetical protein